MFSWTHWAMGTLSTKSIQCNAWGDIFKKSEKKLAQIVNGYIWNIEIVLALASILLHRTLFPFCIALLTSSLFMIAFNASIFSSVFSTARPFFLSLSLHPTFAQFSLLFYRMDFVRVGNLSEEWLLVLEKKMFSNSLQKQ